VDSDGGDPRERSQPPDAQEGAAPVPGASPAPAGASAKGAGASAKDRRARARERERERRAARSTVFVDPRYGRYVGFFALFLLLLFTVNLFVSRGHSAGGVAAGSPAPPFAVPLVTGTLQGRANTATGPNQGAKVVACEARGAAILNICQLYERAPVVLSLFVYAGSCEAILGDMQALAPSFPGVRFAAVAIKGDRGALRSLVRKRGLTFPVGLDEYGDLASLYNDASCPQVTFVLPGGTVQSAALLDRPSRRELRARVSALVAAARARGWRGGGA
jgi:hypothetical protein